MKNNKYRTRKQQQSALFPLPSPRCDHTTVTVTGVRVRLLNMLLGLPTAVGTKVVTRYSKMLPRNQKNKTYISLFVVLSFVCFFSFLFSFPFFLLCMCFSTDNYFFSFCFVFFPRRTIMYQYPVENFLWCAFCCSFFPCLSRGRAGLVGYEGQGVSRGRFGHGGGRGEGVTALLGLRLSLSVR